MRGDLGRGYGFVVEVLARENVLDGGCAREGRDAREMQMADYLGGTHGEGEWLL